MSSELVTGDTERLQSKANVGDDGSPPASPLSTLPSTPPVPTYTQMAASKGRSTSGDEMPPPVTRGASAKSSTAGRKRSREAVEEEQANTADGSSTAAEPLSNARGKKRGNSTDSVATAVKDSQNQSRPQHQPNEEAPSQNVPASGQGQATANAQPAKSNKVIPAQTSQPLQPVVPEQSAEGLGKEDDYESGSESSVLASEMVPEESIEDFDWSHLVQRHHDKMNELRNQDAQLMTEFNALIDVSNVACYCGEPILIHSSTSPSGQTWAIIRSLIVVTSGESRWSCTMVSLLNPE